MSFCVRVRIGQLCPILHCESFFFLLFRLMLCCLLATSFIIKHFFVFLLLLFSSWQCIKKGREFVPVLEKLGFFFCEISLFMLFFLICRDFFLAFVVFYWCFFLEIDVLCIKRGKKWRR